MKMMIERVSVPKTQIYVKILQAENNQLGKNRPVAFILPGGPGADHTVYLKYSYLQKVADLVFHDPRGCGQSDKGIANSYTMDNYIDDVEAIRRHLEVNKIVVIGKSYGSMCALGFALRYPDSTQQLVLSAGGSSYHFLEDAKKNMMRIGTPQQVKIAEKLFSGSFANNNELLEYFTLSQPLYSMKSRSQKMNTISLIEKSQHFSYEVLNEGFKNSFWHFDYDDQLSTIHCPTLILAGREDWINPLEYSELMANRIPHSKICVFDDASHAMEIDVGEEYFETIAKFIAAQR